MATILYIGTSGSDDPTRATIPFHAARGAVEAGHVPAVVLVGEATYLLKDSIAANVQGFGVPPVKELMDFLISEGISFYV